MKKIFLHKGVIAALLILCSCAEESHDEEVNSAIITIESPTASSVVHFNDTLHIQGTIVSVLDLHGYDVNIFRNDDSSAVFFYEEHYHSNNKHFDIKWVCDLDTMLALNMVVTANLDHEGNVETRSVNFFCEP